MHGEGVSIVHFQLRPPAQETSEKEQLRKLHEDVHKAAGRESASTNETNSMFTKGVQCAGSIEPLVSNSNRCGKACTALSFP